MNDEENKDDGFVLIPTKTTGNFSILKRGSTFVNPKRIYYKVYGCYVPFGIEEYNKNFLVNIEITEDKNFNYNLLVSLKNMCNALIDLKDTKSGKEKYLISDKEFFNFMNLVINKDKEEENKKYKLRLYLKKGCKILNKQDEIQNHSDVKRKRCNMVLEVGSLWVNEKTKKYGVNIYVSEIVVC